MKKYKVPVVIETIASHVIGFVECDDIEEYENEAEKLWESKGYDAPTTNITCDFELNDWQISDIEECDIQYYKNEGKDENKRTANT